MKKLKNYCLLKYVTIDGHLCGVNQNMIKIAKNYCYKKSKIIRIINCCCMNKY